MADIFETEEEHSERGPSTAHRWRRCAPSVAKCRGLPDDAGIEAALGTVFHEFAAITLEFDVDQFQMVGSRMRVKSEGVWITLEFDLEMATKMQPGIDWVRAHEGPNTRLFVERRVDLQEWIGPGEFGTSDAFILDIENWRIIVFDWKWGAGVPVSPIWNDQAILYFLGVWTTYARAMFEQAWAEADLFGEPDDQLDIDDIEVVICIEQPRAPGGGGVWETTVGELLKEGEKVRRDAAMTEDPNAPFVPGPKQCKFCAASKFQTCEAERDYILSMFDIDTDDLEVAFLSGSDPELRDKRALTPEQRSALLLATSQIKGYLDNLHAQAYADAQNDVEVPGMFLADGRRPARKWKDEKKAHPIIESKIGSKAWGKKWLTPTAVEDIVGKEVYERHFAALVDQGEAKPQLVPAESGKTPVKSRREQLDEAFDEAANETETLI